MRKSWRVCGRRRELGFSFAQRPSRTLLFKPFYREHMVLTVPSAWRLPTTFGAWKPVIADQRSSATTKVTSSLHAGLPALFGNPRRKFQQGDHYTELKEVMRARSPPAAFQLYRSIRQPH